MPTPNEIIASRKATILEILRVLQHSAGSVNAASEILCEAAGRLTQAGARSKWTRWRSGRQSPDLEALRKVLSIADRRGLLNELSGAERTFAFEVLGRRTSMHYGSSGDHIDWRELDFRLVSTHADAKLNSLARELCQLIHIATEGQRPAVESSSNKALGDIQRQVLVGFLAELETRTNEVMANAEAAVEIRPRKLEEPFNVVEDGWLSWLCDEFQDLAVIGDTGLYLYGMYFSRLGKGPLPRKPESIEIYMADDELGKLRKFDDIQIFGRSGVYSMTWLLDSESNAMRATIYTELAKIPVPLGFALSKAINLDGHRVICLEHLLAQSVNSFERIPDARETMARRIAEIAHYFARLDLPIRQSLVVSYIRANSKTAWSMASELGDAAKVESMRTQLAARRSAEKEPPKARRMTPFEV